VDSSGFWEIGILCHSLEFGCFQCGFCVWTAPDKNSSGIILCINLCLYAYCGLSVFCGSAVAHIIPDLWGEKLGGIILLGIGLWCYSARGKRIRI